MSSRASHSLTVDQIELIPITGIDRDATSRVSELRESVVKVLKLYFVSMMEVREGGND